MTSPRSIADRYLGDRGNPVQRVAARYKKKKEVPKADGNGTTTVYEYSERQVQNRNRDKAERIEKLRKGMSDIRAQVKKDLTADDPKTRLTALAVALMDETFERVGNGNSAEESGHFGVTTWKVKHFTLSKDKATIRYVGKSGVKQEKEVTTPAVLSALRKAMKGKGKDEEVLCEGDDCRVLAEDVNKYLKPYDITAKDIRGLHANEEMKTRLKAIRSKGGKLPDEKKDREKRLKDEFKQALEEAAEAVGHEPSTLRSQYLVPGLEDSYTKDGTVMDRLDKKAGAFTDYAAAKARQDHEEALRRAAEMGLTLEEWQARAAGVMRRWLRRGAEERHKYPRTPHLPWSPGATSDDRMLTTTAHFDGKIVVVTEKLDGENCTIGRTYTHARSLDSLHHPSRAWVKGLQAQIGPDIPEGWRLCGENLFAKHSIGYEDLPSYFMLFSIWNGNNVCLSWDETEDWATLLGVKTVPVLYKGPWDPDKIADIFEKYSKGKTVEGYVVRMAGSFPFGSFDQNIAKFVRAGHVQTGPHWMQQKMVPNKLKPEKVAFRKMATKTPSEREDEESERLVRKEPKAKPPRNDLRRERVNAEKDPDLSTDDKDLSLNYKDIEASAHHVAVQHELRNLLAYVRMTKKTPARVKREEEEKKYREKREKAQEKERGSIELEASGKKRQKQKKKEEKAEKARQKQKETPAATEETPEKPAGWGAPAEPAEPASKAPATEPTEEKPSKKETLEERARKTGKADFERYKKEYPETEQNEEHFYKAALKRLKKKEKQQDKPSTEQEEEPNEQELKDEALQREEKIRKEKVKGVLEEVTSLSKALSSAGSLPKSFSKDVESGVANMSAKQRESFVLSFTKVINSRLHKEPSPEDAIAEAREVQERELDIEDEGPWGTQVFADPEKAGELLAKKIYADRVTLNPLLIGEAPLSDEQEAEGEKDQAKQETARRKRAEAAYEHFSQLEEAEWTDAAKKIEAELKTVHADSPRGREVRSLYHGLCLAAAVQGKPIPKMKGAQGNNSETLTKLARVLKRRGEEKVLLGNTEELTSPETREKLEASLNTLSDVELGEFVGEKSPLYGISKALQGPLSKHLGTSDRKELRSMMITQISTSMTVLDPLIEDYMGANGKAYSPEKQKSVRQKSTSKVDADASTKTQAALATLEDEEAPEKEVRTALQLLADLTPKSVVDGVKATYKYLKKNFPKEPTGSVADVIAKAIGKDGNLSALTQRAVPRSIQGSSGTTTAWDFAPWPEFGGNVN